MRARTRNGSIRPTTFVVGLLLCLCGGRTDAADDWAEAHRALLAELRREWTEAGEVRALRIQLEDALLFRGNKLRIQADRQGLDRRDLHLRLRRRGQTWLSGAVDDLGADFRRRFVLHALDPSGLALHGERLTGVVAMTSSRHCFRRDMHGAIVYHHIPSTEIPVPEWRLGGAHRARPFTERFRIDVDLAAATGRYLRLRLARGIRLPQRARSDAELRALAEEQATKKAANKGREIGGDYWRKVRAEYLAGLERKRVRLQAHRFRKVRLAARWHPDGTTDGWAAANRYNKAFHRVDPGGLRAADGRLRGELRIRYNPDPWVSPPGGGPRWQTYRFDLPLPPDGRVAGTVSASGAYGDFETTVEGLCVPLARGRYRGTGPDGEVAGRATVALHPVLPGLPEAVPTEPLDRLRDAAACLALRLEPGRGFAALRRKAPVFHGAADLVRELAPVLRRHRRSGPAAPRTGRADGDGEHGPYTGPGRGLPVDADGRQIVPAAEEDWCFHGAWRWLGPIPTGGGTPLVQAIATGADTVDTTEGERRWRKTTTTTPRFLPAGIAAAVERTRPRAFAWYACTEFELEVAGDYRLALPAHRHGACWLDGVLVWRGGERADALDTAVFRRRLEAGPHRVVLRAGMDDLRWSSHTGSVKAVAHDRLPFAATGLQLRRVADGGDDAEGETATAGTAGAIAVPPLATQIADGGVPVAWSFATGANLRWELPLADGAVRPVIVGDACAVAVPGRVRCVALADGSERWRAEIPGGPVGLVVHEAGVLVGLDTGETLCLGAADGGVRWRRAAEPPAAETETLEATVLPPRTVDDALVLAWRLRVAPATEGGSPRRRVAYRCLAAADGDERWSLVRPGSVPGLEGMTLRRGERSRRVWISSQGDVVDPSNGALLHEGLLALPCAGTRPTVAGQQAIFAATDHDRWLGGWISGWKAAIRVWLTAGGRVGARRLWRSKGPSHYPGPPAVVDGDLFYLSRTNNGHHQEGPAPLTRLHVYERATGTLLAELSPLLHRNTAPKGLRLVHGRLYAADEGGDQYFNADSRPRLAVVAPGTRPLVLAINRIPEGSLAPVFAEDCLLVAGEGRLVCLAADDPADRRWQVDTVSRRVIEAIGSRPVAPGQTVHRPEPLAAGADPALPVWRLRPGSAPEHLLRLGPFPLAAPEDAWRPALTEPVRVAREGLDIAGEIHLPADPPAGTVRFGGTVWHAYDNAWGYCDGWVIDGWTALGNRAHRRVVLMCLLEVRIAGTYALRVGSRGVAVALAGETIAHGAAVDLRPGRYPFAISFGLGEIPAILRGRRISVPVAFRPRLPIAERQRRWRERVRAARPVIDELLAALPADSPMRPVLTVMRKDSE